MAKFIKACECPNCGNICLDDGYTFDFQTDDNVIALNCFSNTEWYCEECNSHFGTCNLDDILEEF